jgi:predicted RNase H-like HicB family nuclease
MKLELSVQIWKKGLWFIARCPELDFVSQGRTRDESKHNLMEVIEIQFEEMSEMGTLDEYMDECGSVNSG